MSPLLSGLGGNLLLLLGVGGSRTERNDARVNRFDGVPSPAPNSANRLRNRLDGGRRFHLEFFEYLPQMIR